MNPATAFAVGIAPQHLPALLAALALPVLVGLARRLRPPGAAGQSPRPTPVRAWAAWALGIAAAVHLALPLGHNDGALLTVGFLASGAGYAWLAMRAWEGRSWRLLSALLLVGTLAAYLSIAGFGREEPDQVGIGTALVELFALGLCLLPQRQPGRPRRFARFVGGSVTVLVAVLTGAVIWAGSFAAHAAASRPGTAAVGNSATVHVEHGEHSHAHAARAQAGVVMRPASAEEPTADQRDAARRLAEATRTALRRYARLTDALSAGYQLPKPGTGPDVHLDNPALHRDGRVLDPQRPEMLVYAISGGRATLLGVVFVMERAGVAGPEPGGSITRWHAHNICLTALPPGFGPVTPFGSCPALSLAVTTPEMMHVWVVDNPGGAFAEGLDQQWVHAYHAQHGQLYSTG